MRTWHYRRIKFVLCEPKQAPNGNWVFFYVCVKNDDPKSAFRETHWACESLGL